MSISRAAVAATLWVISLPAAGCAPRQPAPFERSAQPLPELPVTEVSDRSARLAVREPNEVADPLARLPLGGPVSLTAAAVDVATLLVALGEAVGISLVVDPEIDERITVNFDHVPAREALRVVLAESNLFIAAGAPDPPFGPVVFYTLPIDIEQSSVETIAARFGVSREAAEFIVRARVR